MHIMSHQITGCHGLIGSEPIITHYAIAKLGGTWGPGRGKGGLLGGTKPSNASLGTRVLNKSTVRLRGAWTGSSEKVVHVRSAPGCRASSTEPQTTDLCLVANEGG